MLMKVIHRKRKHIGELTFMMPALNHKSFQTILLLISIFALSITAVPCRQSLAREDITGIDKVLYYTESQGVFTIKSPPAGIGYYLPLKGTCSLPELVIQIRKKNASFPTRQASYRLNGRSDFNTKYLIKDGAGEYEVIIFGKKTISSSNLSGLCAFSVRSELDLPKNMPGLYLNDKVLAYVSGVIGKTIGGGECWDLAQEALDSNGADWSRPLSYGMLLDPGKDRIRPGDIIQFKSVRLQAKLPNGGMMYRTIGAPDHTAIIISVEGEKKYKLAHQNSDGKRYVITSEVDMNSMITGKYWIYRPLAGFIK
jgi:hypothetical protein